MKVLELVGMSCASSQPDRKKSLLVNQRLTRRVQRTSGYDDNKLGILRRTDHIDEFGSNASQDCVCFIDRFKHDKVRITPSSVLLGASVSLNMDEPVFKGDVTWHYAKDRHDTFTNDPDDPDVTSKSWLFRTYFVDEDAQIPPNLDIVQYSETHAVICIVEPTDGIIELNWPHRLEVLVDAIKALPWKPCMVVSRALGDAPEWARHLPVVAQTMECIVQDGDDCELIDELFTIWSSPTLDFHHLLSIFWAFVHSGSFDHESHEDVFYAISVLKKFL